MDESIEYRIPGTILFSDQLGRKEKLLFAYFYTYHLQYKMGCTTSNVQLSYIIGTDKNKVSKSIKKLSDLGYIKIEYKNRTPIKERTHNAGVAKYFQKETQFHNILRIITVSEKYTKRKRRIKNHDS